MAKWAACARLPFSKTGSKNTSSPHRWIGGLACLKIKKLKNKEKVSWWAKSRLTRPKKYKKTKKKYLTFFDFFYKTVGWRPSSPLAHQVGGLARLSPPATAGPKCHPSPPKNAGWPAGPDPPCHLYLFSPLITIYNVQILALLYCFMRRS